MRGRTHSCCRSCLCGQRLAGTATPAPNGPTPPPPQQNCPGAALDGGVVPLLLDRSVSASI
ncbi:hypothetical protein E4K10_42080 [Streptomyces sp. T1317-0309]|nr:hypothetical protein E4K10_42080 [Streptomyces sp. T1317-0309]